VLRPDVRTQHGREPWNALRGSVDEGVGRGRRHVRRVAHWHVADLDAKLAEVTASGATVKEPAHDGGERLVVAVTNPDGDVLGLLQDR
jgi:predicted enzyme related to lactoylglutathione lyase